MLGKIFKLLITIWLVFMFGMLLLLTVDVVDGRNMHLSTSPYFKADTNDYAFAFYIGIWFVCAFLLILALISKTNKTNQL